MIAKSYSIYNYRISPSFLKEHGTEPIDLIKLFVNNGYKISLDGFLINNYISIGQLMAKTEVQENCYIIHQDIVEIINKINYLFIFNYMNFF